MDEQYNILARTIYGEARGEYAKTGPAAFMAIAYVVKNRLRQPKRFGASIQEVCQKPYQFSCWNKNDPNYTLISGVINHQLFQKCYEVGRWVFEQPGDVSDITNGSNHYHTKTIQPYWSKNIKPALTLGNHVFYNIGGHLC